MKGAVSPPGIAARASRGAYLQTGGRVKLQLGPGPECTDHGPHRPSPVQGHGAVGERSAWLVASSTVKWETAGSLPPGTGVQEGVEPRAGDEGEFSVIPNRRTDEVGAGSPRLLQLHDPTGWSPLALTSPGMMPGLLASRFFVSGGSDKSVGFGAERQIRPVGVTD